MSDTPNKQGAHEQDTGVTHQQAKRQRSVVFYIAILFIAAFLLLLLSSVMERRQHSENLDDLNDSITGLKDSVSAMQSVQDLYEENDQLKEEKRLMEDEILNKGHENAALQEELDKTEKSVQAMDWFWQIDEAFVRGRYKLCRDLIGHLEDAELQEYLPKDSITDNERFSPYDRYLEIRGKVIQ